ncbi:NADPH-dependent F420 reductase [Anaeromyxobacter terrae]|uniref:NADPH-dependent F420 reductase n=1 Tax=Anaeromyxobacter terrae TaxID=2925406 RepID=UPI001F58AF5B|nr:NAD(P)-binding domain-containing protein [Anaeromyxobacter sp. SG22]
MRMGILGTGDVGRTLGTKLVELGHEVRLGSRTAANEKGQAWAREAGARASSGTFADAAAFGEVVLNCTLGVASLDALRAAGEANLAGKVLVDVANALDASKGGPPILAIGNTDSLAEAIQRAFPGARVVKALNTMWCGVMVNPRMLPDSHHTYLSGNDAEAKKVVKGLLRSFGWREEEILDLGDLSTARGTESILPLWLRIYGVSGSGAFNFKVVSAKAG